MKRLNIDQDELNRTKTQLLPKTYTPGNQAIRRYVSNNSKRLEKTRRMRKIQDAENEKLKSRIVLIVIVVSAVLLVTGFLGVWSV